MNRKMLLVAVSFFVRSCAMEEDKPVVSMIERTESLDWWGNQFRINECAVKAHARLNVKDVIFNGSAYLVQPNGDEEPSEVHQGMLDEHLRIAHPQAIRKAVDKGSKIDVDQFPNGQYRLKLKGRIRGTGLGLAAIFYGTYWGGVAYATLFASRKIMEQSNTPTEALEKTAAILTHTTGIARQGQKMKELVVPSKPTHNYNDAGIVDPKKRPQRNVPTTPSRNASELKSGTVSAPQSFDPQWEAQRDRLQKDWDAVSNSQEGQFVKELLKSNIDDHAPTPQGVDIIGAIGDIKDALTEQAVPRPSQPFYPMTDPELIAQYMVAANQGKSFSAVKPKAGEMIITVHKDETKDPIGRQFARHDEVWYAGPVDEVLSVRKRTPAEMDEHHKRLQEAAGEWVKSPMGKLSEKHIRQMMVSYITVNGTLIKAAEYGEKRFGIPGDDIGKAVCDSGTLVMSDPSMMQTVEEVAKIGVSTATIGIKGAEAVSLVVAGGNAAWNAGMSIPAGTWISVNCPPLAPYLWWL